MTMKTVGHLLPHQKPSIQAVLAKLSEWNIRFFIGGGYARDVMHGAPAKDLDICIYGSIEIQQVLEALYELNINPNIKGPADACYAGIDRVYSVCEFNLDGVEVDIILYVGESVEEVVTHFDCNLNMYTLEEPRSSSRFVGVCYWGYQVNMPERKLRFNPARKELTEERRLYMQRKADNLGWKAGD